MRYNQQPTSINLNVPLNSWLGVTQLRRSNEVEKEKDLKILANAFFAELFVSDVAYGAIGIDCKRPFGNSNVEGDILEMLEWKAEENDGTFACYSTKQREYARNLYKNDLIPYLRRRWANMSNHVTISREVYDELLKDQKQLRKLEAAGVDNWEGYPPGDDDEEESYEDIYGKNDT